MREADKGGMRGATIDILMYHSVSDAGGPTSIPADIFADQMQALADSGVPVLSMDQAVSALTGEGAAPRRAVAITFDDAFQDFADTAWPELSRHGFPAMVYVPTTHVGKAESWRGAASPARPLMDWPTIRALSEDGADFGSHTQTHPDLVSLPDDVLAVELSASHTLLSDQLGKPVSHFAPPYGRAGAREQAGIARLYQSSVSTELGQARTGDNPHDLPRLEMFYFQDLRRWRAHLAGRGGAYLMARRALRRVREAVQSPWDKQK
ncbi:MAG: polysaccharide deacetylase family protein [Marinibacterium sp.]